MEHVELLLPAQNKKSITAARDFANAIYFGVDTLNMRQSADNIPLNQLSNIVSYCHSFGIKAYLTTNVIIYENELDFVTNQLQTAKDAGIDAVIIHDLAVIQIAQTLKIPFHISTQASISNSKAAKFYENLGADRVILAREVSLEQIKEIISKVTRLKVEVFVHGAQCTSVSGRCYFSAELNEDSRFSANRGACLQPCRNKWTIMHETGKLVDYDGIYFVNAKDLCMIEYIPQLIEAKIAAFKVEGRMREPRYMEVVGRCYREAIDSYYDGTYTSEKGKLWLEQLRQVYNRGFSTGFYFNRPDVTDISRSASGNLGTEKKVQIGKVITYYREAKAAKIELLQGQLRIGDEIYFEGGRLGTFLKQKLVSIQLKTKQITITPNATPENPLTIGIGVDEPVKKGDWIYRYETKLFEKKEI